MPAWLSMFYRDFKRIEEKNIDIKRDIAVVHWTGEEGYARVGEPKVIGYTVSQKLENMLKIAYVKRGNVALADYSETTSLEGVYVRRIQLPCDESKIDWSVANHLDDIVKCNIRKKIFEEFGIDIAPHHKKDSREDDNVNIRSKHWGSIPDELFIGR